MTQTPRPQKRPPKTNPLFTPEPGMTVQLKGAPQHTGTVAKPDAWWDLLLLRGVDISAQTLVEWPSSISGQPVKSWVRNSDLEQVLSPPAGELSESTGEKGTSRA